MIIQIIQTSIFLKQKKKLYKSQKKDLDQAIKIIVEKPFIGEMKKGTLDDVLVYKFSMAHQLVLLAYKFNQYEYQLIFMLIGSHENFYRDLKKINS